MAQTKEVRIYRHYQSIRTYPHWMDIEEELHGLPEIHPNKQERYDTAVLHLARHWKMPCKEIKAAIKQARTEAV